ncbi:MAG TPA: glycosyltransferase [Rhodobacteraceae bacterium]|nr:glycosyltransferase [Paracoccaceae bacterium]
MHQGSKKTGQASLVAVVVTYNRLAQLKTTLACLLAHPPELLRAVVVVDNASGDATAGWLGGQDDARLLVHRLAENLGGAGGFEAGMRAAVDRFDPDWIVVMDDDARPRPGALAAFHGKPRSKDTALAAAVYYPDGKVCEMNRPALNPVWHRAVFLRSLTGGRGGFHLADTAYRAHRPSPVDMSSFVGLFLSREIIGQAGYPDRRLFLYGDDVIYTLEMRRKGLKLHFEPEIGFEHDCTTFADDRARAFRPIWKVYYTYRNGLIRYRAMVGPLVWLLLPLLALKWYRAAGRYGADRKTYLRLMRRAIGDGIRGDLRRRHGEVLALAR